MAFTLSFPPETDIESGTTRHYFTVLEDGKAVGELAVRENPNDPAEIFIEDFYSDEGVSLGFRGVRDLGLKIKRHFPHITKISGTRYGGAALSSIDIEAELDAGRDPARFTSVNIPKRYRTLD